jgi:hypothetical protein
MEIIGQFVWIAFFAAAFLLWVSKRGNWAIILAFVGFGLPGFALALAKWGVLEYSVLREFNQVFLYVRVATGVLLVAGVIMLIRGGSRAAVASGAMQDAQATNLATLFTPRNETNSVSRAEILRDDACARLVARAKNDGLEVIQQRSQAHSPSVWFRIDYLPPPPAPDLSLPVSVSVEIERFDFHRFEHLFTVTVQIGTRTRKFAGVTALDDSAIDCIHQHLVTPGWKFLLKNRVREWPWQLWRPRNKVQRLRPDWTALVMTLLAIGLGMVPLGIFFTIGIFVWLFFRARGRRTYVLTSGKPLTDPRSLRWMDSWQVSISSLGKLASAVRQGIMTRLGSGGPDGANVAVERIGYWGTDRWVEREQIVISHRRAIGFIHVVSYGDVLYVAWESHLNSASWVEQTLTQGVDRVSGLNVVANHVIAGSHRLNEYDVSDSNFLAEWMHEAVKSEVKLRMAEHKIDQEIDFTVQRGSREDAVAASAQLSPSGEKPGTKRFKRLA